MTWRPLLLFVLDLYTVVVGAWAISVNGWFGAAEVLVVGWILAGAWQRWFAIVADTMVCMVAEDLERVRGPV